MKRFWTLGCIWLFTALSFAQSPIFPDSVKTPGEIRGDSLETICHSGYTKIVRDVSTNRKQMVYNSYMIDPIMRKNYVIDHLIPLGLGGSNNISNLWAQDRRTKSWNDIQKNVLGNFLRKKVCSGELDLTVAQNAMRTNWVDAYNKYYLNRWLQVLNR